MWLFCYDHGLNKGLNQENKTLLFILKTLIESFFDWLLVFTQYPPEDCTDVFKENLSIRYTGIWCTQIMK